MGLFVWQTQKSEIIPYKSSQIFDTLTGIYLTKMVDFGQGLRGYVPFSTSKMMPGKKVINILASKWEVRINLPQGGKFFAPLFGRTLRNKKLVLSLLLSGLI